MKLPVAILLFAALASVRAELADSVAALVAVGREGEGNEAAAVAWRDVVKAGPAALPALVAASGKANSVADNWLRLAGDVIVENALRSHEAIPIAALEAFLKDEAHLPAGRVLAFDLIAHADHAKAQAIEPLLLQDPVQSLRRGAVARLIDAAKRKTGEQMKAGFIEAFDAVRDEDQTAFLVGELKRLGVTIDLPVHFGFLMKWNIIGPFDNTGRKGFDTAFPPEKEVKLDENYDGKNARVKWQPFESKDEYGKLDFNKPYGLLKETTAYAATTFDTLFDRDAELRLGCKNAWKVWLNGTLLFARDEYHRGQEMDQYKLKCHLNKGANVILVKCCQDEEKEQWTNEWEFQLRVCDSSGTAILSASKSTP